MDGEHVQDRALGSVAVVLVVDDDPASLKLVRAVLNHHGFATLAATTGVEAVRVAGSRQPDLVLLDIGLPDIDGVEVLRQLRADDRSADLPAIAVTAFAMSDDRDRLLAAGFDRHVAKPIDPDRLMADVRTLLDRR